MFLIYVFQIPKSARLTYGYDEVTGRKTLFPNVSTRNVYMFPGIPQLMEKLFDLLCKVIEIFVIKEFIWKGKVPKYE